jgi:hypothetical protein
LSDHVVLYARFTAEEGSGGDAAAILGELIEGPPQLIRSEIVGMFSRI